MTRRPAHRLARRDAGGYVLLIVLVACGLFGLVVASLLATVGTDSRAGVAYTTSGAAKRAVDGGLQVGIGTVKSVGSSTLAASADPCSGFAPNLQVTIEQRPVDVSCADATEAAPRSIPSAGDGSTVLTLLREWDIGAVTPAPLSDGEVPTLGQRIQSAVSHFGGTTADNPGLIHVAEEPLKIYGSVNVRQWSLASVPRTAGSAVSVAGSYREGDAEGAACGSAETFFGLFTPPRTGKVVSTGTTTCAVGRDNVVLASGPNYPVPTATTASGAVPSCVPGGTIAFAPGAYDSAQILQMNQMFGEGTCDGVTFWFQPGEYFFNAAGNTAQGAVYFNDSTSNFVFGAPKGWSLASRALDSVFPEACDRGAQGVAIVLGPTTSIVHNRGVVSMCGRTSGGTPVPVLSQQPAVTLPASTWSTEPDSVTAGFGSPPDAANVAASVAAESGQYQGGGKPYDGSEVATRRTSAGTCVTSCQRSWVLAGWGSPLDPGSTRPITSAVLKIRASTSNVRRATWPATPWSPESQTKVLFTRADDQAQCYAIRDGENSWPTSMATPFEIDLIGASQQCRGVIRNQQDLERGKLEIYFFLNGNWCSYFLCQDPVLSYSFDYAWVETTTAASSSPDPTPMALQIDAANHRSFNVFGRVVLPRTQIDVKWRGSPTAPPTYELPIFVGDVVARGMISGTPDEYSWHVGPLASRALTATSRRVRIRASINGRLLGSTVVSITDIRPGQTTLSPGVELKTTDWAYCNVPLTPSAHC